MQKDSSSEEEGGAHIQSSLSSYSGTILDNKGKHDPHMTLSSCLIIDLLQPLSQHVTKCMNPIIWAVATPTGPNIVVAEQALIRPYKPPKFLVQCHCHLLRFGLNPFNHTIGSEHSGCRATPNPPLQTSQVSRPMSLSPPPLWHESLRRTPHPCS
jgi:hypothetical protein